MKAGELNDWLGVFTNIGVIVGLALVAYEIHQNNIALESEERVSIMAVNDATREAWQTWDFAILENRDVAEIWVKGNSGEPLDELEEYRYELLAKEMFRLIAQNYRQYSTISGEPADWAIRQLIQSAKRSRRLKSVFVEELERVGRQGASSSYESFSSRIRELDPPELRVPKADN